MNNELFNEAMNGLDPSLIAEHLNKREEYKANGNTPARSFVLRRIAVAAAAAAVVAAGAAGAILSANRAPEPPEVSGSGQGNQNSAEYSFDGSEDSTKQHESVGVLEPGSQYCPGDDIIMDHASIEQETYKITENITCDLQFASPTKYEELAISADGFEVIGYTAVDENHAKITIKYKGEKTETVLNILLPDKESLNVYGLRVEDRIYVSTFMLDMCYMNYYMELVNAGEITLDELWQNMSEFTRRHGGVEEWGYGYDDSEPERVNNTISGTVRWKDDNYNFHPLGYVQVDLINADDNSVIASQYSNPDGSYAFITNVSPALGYSIKLYADNSNVAVKSTGSAVYVQSSATYSYSKHITINLDVNMSSYAGRAFQVFEAAETAARYADYMNGSDLGKISVVYPGTQSFSYYYTSNNTIYLSNVLTGNPKVYASWDVITHEYGHHVMYVLGIQNNPGGNHSITLNDIDENSNKSIGIRLSWGESWPTVFGEMAQQYYSSYLTNIAYVADSQYNSYNGVYTDYETPSVALGDACEENLICLLYDLYDSHNETGDYSYWGHTNFWNRSKNSSATTFSEFTQYCYNNNYANRFTFGELLETAHISAYNLTKSTSNTSPTFTWNVGGGNTTLSRNNSFYLVFYNNAGGEIRRYNVSTNGTPTTVSYNINSLEWSYIVSQSGTNIIVAVIAYQNGAPSTGGYYSAKHYF